VLKLKAHESAENTNERDDNREAFVIAKVRSKNLQRACADFDRLHQQILSPLEMAADVGYGLFLQIYLEQQTAP